MSKADEGNAGFAPMIEPHGCAARRRKAVLLQGPPGPFFGHLQTSLDELGWDTVRILFNRGDSHFHGGGRDVVFSGPKAQWPTWIATFLDSFKPDVALIFGDQRPFHRGAMAACAIAGVPIVNFGEAGARADCVTMELLGSDAPSPERASLSTPLGRAANALSLWRASGERFAAMARRSIVYHALSWLGIARFPRQRRPGARGLLRESFVRARSAARKWRYARENLRATHWIVESLDARYFVLALHGEEDARRPGGSWTVESLLDASLASFALHADRDHHLVVKCDQIDCGEISAREMTARQARRRGVEKRVHFLDDGSLSLLTRHSRGMVTVDAASAMAAFPHSRPVFVAGESPYEHLAANGADRSIEALGRFWTLSPPIETSSARNAAPRIVATRQISGGYYLASQIAPTAARVVKRLDELLGWAGSVAHPVLNGAALRPAQAVSRAAKASPSASSASAPSIVGAST